MNDDFLFIVSVLGIAILSLIFLMVLLGNSLKLTRLTIPSFFLIAYIILGVVPSTIMFYNSLHPIRYTYFLATQSVLITFPLGVFLANTFFRNPSRIIERFLSSSIVKTKQDRYFTPIFLVMIMFSIAIITIYINVADYVPLFGSISNYGEMDAEWVRFSIYRVPEAVQYAYALTVRFFLPFCTLYAYFMTHAYKSRWKYVFWLVFILSAISSSLVFERSNILGLFILLGLACCFKDGNKTKLKQLFIFAIAIFIVGGIISTAQYNSPFAGAQGIWNSAKTFLISRIFLDPSYMSYFYFEMFSDPSTFLYGRSIRLFSLFDVEYYPVTSPGFVAELWLNFGWPGVILWTIVIGFLLQFIQLKFFKTKSIPILSGYILLLLNGIWIIYGHVLATMVVSVYSLTILFIFFLSKTKEAGVAKSFSLNYKKNRTNSQDKLMED